MAEDGGVGWVAGNAAVLIKAGCDSCAMTYDQPALTARPHRSVLEGTREVKKIQTQQTRLQ
ncbi:hypothetical protein JYU34_000623 [Plutella xylostella]|uniref:Uncharacterized protein n=1 Tax=Plutella xylostella TaxID=51655 RepID=A0ABQ7R861_PLUXY|nr:hypothetical protein JYU34_000623 [Plutella xylostella]